nr:uncharacterized protein LOC111502029 isoform X1 [Leptinotarsa decemlineata]
MNHRLAFVVAIFFFCGVGCVDIKKVESIISQRVENDTEAASTEFPTGKGRSSRMIYAELVSCAVRYDTSCLVDVAEDYLEVQRQELLAQADAQVSASGRANPDNSPSHLAKTIEKLLSELAGMFKSGISSFFREAADDDEIDDADDNSIDNENKDDEKNSRDVVEVDNHMREYKKKKKYGPIAKIIHLIHKIIFGVVVVTLLIFVLRFFYAGIALGYFLLDVKYFVMKAIKFWIWIKQYKSVEPIIHYEHVEHDHHGSSDSHVEYEHDFDDHNHHHSNNPYWGKEDYAHSLAYSKQKPDSVSSWWG